MGKFGRDCRGAVTVFVTLLLIPAILVSGTGVDLARLYAARSVTRDANQLAANAVLTCYDAALQDIYGLYAVAASDDTLLAMVDTYVRASLFGEEVTDQQLGEFRLFAGTEDVSSSLETLDPLRDGNNVAVLRRQIEEYAKWRVPVAIVQEFLSRLDSEEIEQTSKDSQVTTQKIKVDEKLEALMEKYRAVKTKIDSITANYTAAEKKAFQDVNNNLNDISLQMIALLNVRTSYEDAAAEGADANELETIKEHYGGIIDNITALVMGGEVSQWSEQESCWENPQDTEGIYSVLTDVEKDLESIKTGLDELVTLCRQADAAKNELKTMITELRNQLNTSGCTDSLSENMGKELDSYEALLNYDFEVLAVDMKKKGDACIDSTKQLFASLEQHGWGYINPDTNALMSPNIPFGDLFRLGSLSAFMIDLNVNPASYPGVSDTLKNTMEHIPSLYSVPYALLWLAPWSAAHSFPMFDTDCYSALKELGTLKSEDDSGLSEEEKNSKQGILDLYDKVKDLWNGLTDYDPSPGAFSYDKTTGQAGNSFAVSKSGPTLDLGLGDFGDNLVDTVKTFTGLVTGNIDVGQLIGSALDDAADRILLVGYDTQMFSCWVTESGTVSLSGHEIGAANNYFYRSELEYLYNGSLDAKSNLGAVTMTLLVIRFLANYASTYMIDDVNEEIQIYEELVSLVPYAGSVLRFLVRPLIVLAESLVDVSNLRNHDKVPLLKTKRDNWTVSLSGGISSALDSQNSGDNGFGLTYTDYLTIFLLVGNPDTIAARTGDLIALNMTTAQKSIAQNNKDTSNDERAAAIASVKLFDLSKAYTTFSIQTTTAVRFVFLSMPFAQKGIHGVVPPKTFPVVETDYRGY